MFLKIVFHCLSAHLFSLTENVLYHLEQVLYWLVDEIVMLWDADNSFF